MSTPMSTLHRPTSSWRTVLTALTAAAVASLAAPAVAETPAPAAPGESRVILDEGHIDLFEVAYDATTARFVTQLKDDTRTYTGLADPPVFRRPDSVVVQVPEESTRLEVTEDLPQSYQSLIGPPGTVVNYLSEVQPDGAPWPGWSTERLLAQLRDAGITLTESTSPSYRGIEAVDLDVDVTGPGDVFTFAEGSEGPINVFVDTRTAEPDVIPIPVGSHVHTAWVFTRPGTYELQVTPRAEKVGGGAITGPTETYRFQVGGPAVQNLTAPVLDRAADEVRIGTTLSTSVGTWNPSDVLTTTRWYLDGDLVAAGPTFTVPESRYPGASLEGHMLQVETVARREGYSAGRVRTQTYVVRAPEPASVVTATSAKAVTQVFGSTATMSVAVPGATSGTVSARVGATTVRAAVSSGRASLVLPARALAPGRRQFVVSYSGAPGFDPSRTTGTVAVVKARPALRVAAVTRTVTRGRTARVAVAVTAAGVRPTGRVVVRIGGVSRVARLDTRGRAVVRIPVSRRAATGTRAVAVAYLGDAYVDVARGTTRIRVNR